jgi:hypothetical protein
VEECGQYRAECCWSFDNCCQFVAEGAEYLQRLHETRHAITRVTYLPISAGQCNDGHETVTCFGVAQWSELRHAQHVTVMGAQGLKVTRQWHFDIQFFRTPRGTPHGISYFDTCQVLRRVSDHFYKAKFSAVPCACRGRASTRS